MYLSHYCSSLPYTDNLNKKGINYYALRFDTRTCACFTMLYDLFYINNINSVPQDIYNLFSPVSFAYWIMGDGSGTIWRGLYLCPDSFTVYDVVRLMNVLLIRYNFKSNLVFHKGKPRIYIPSTQSEKVYKVVVKHIHPSMLYKITGRSMK